MDNWKLEPARDLGLPLTKQVQSTRREGGLASFIAHLTWSLFTGFYLKIYHRLSIVGRENLPQSGPFVLVANHSSHLDTLVLASAVPWRIRDYVFPIAAGDTFFSTSLSGVVSALFINALPMWRNKKSSHALTDLRDRLMQDCSIFIIFPEGTRTRTGAMARFKAGVGMLIAATTVPVVPCRLIGTYEALPHNRRLPRPTKLRLMIGKPMSFSHLTNDRNGWETVAKEIESEVVTLCRYGPSM